jgi:hypothetical protein
VGQGKSAAVGIVLFKKKRGYLRVTALWVLRTGAGKSISERALSNRRSFCFRYYLREP